MLTDLCNFKYFPFNFMFFTSKKSSNKFSHKETQIIVENKT